MVAPGSHTPVSTSTRSPTPSCADHAFEVIGLVGKGEALQIGDRPWREVPPGSDTYRAQGLTRDPEGSGNGEIHPHDAVELIACGEGEIGVERLAAGIDQQRVHPACG